jgi:pilus assembly protein CpaF
VSAAGHSTSELLRARAAALCRARPQIDRAEFAEIVDELIDDERIILGDADREILVTTVLDEAFGLGPLESLMRDPTVTEIMVNGPGAVFVERDGRLTRAPSAFVDAAHVVHVIDRILAPLGRRVDEASPMADARLPDGSRVHVVIPPLALDGPCLSIRRFPGDPLTADELVANGTMSEGMLRLLRAAVERRLNVLVTGGTSTGKTTTLAALAAFVAAGERVITIEDTAELRLPLTHIVRLESRPPSLEGAGAVPIRELVRNALRMRPDRIVIGEVRGQEALDMLTAMTTGHEGSLSTIHASSPADALRRLQMLALMGDVELTYAAVVDQVSAAIDLIVHQARDADGRRRIVAVAAVARGDGGPEITMLARFDRARDDFAVLDRGEQWLDDAARVP